MLDTFILNTLAHKPQDQALQDIRYLCIYIHLKWPNNFRTYSKGEQTLYNINWGFNVLFLNIFTYIQTLGSTSSMNSRV